MTQPALDRSLITVVAFRMLKSAMWHARLAVTNSVGFAAATSRWIGDSTIRGASARVTGGQTRDTSLRRGRRLPRRWCS